jgi:hypothetical protein
MSRSRLRATALDPNDSFSFANITVDGYSGEELNEGYQTGIILKNGPAGATQLTLFAADGGIRQDGIGQVRFSGPVHAANSMLVDGYLDAYGAVALGNSASDTLYVGATIVSSLLPENNLHLLGDPTQRWIDGYFDFFVPTSYTPIGSNYSLEGHLKGIDAKLGTVASFTHGAYIITVGEAGSNTLDTARLVDQGLQTDVSSLTDTQFRDNVYIYLDGQFMLNDTAKRASNGAVVNDVARDTVTTSLLRFSRDVKKGAIVQVVIMS